MKALADAEIRLVYGAGDIGLMGEVARSAQAGGADTFGVIPGHLVDMEVGKTDLTSYIITETMHERKKVMFMNSDAVLNTKGYWSKLIALLDHVIEEGFADPSLLKSFKVVETVGALMAEFQDETCETILTSNSNKVRFLNPYSTV